MKQHRHRRRRARRVEPPAEGEPADRFMHDLIGVIEDDVHELLEEASRADALADRELAARDAYVARWAELVPKGIA